MGRIVRQRVPFNVRSSIVSTPTTSRSKLRAGAPAYCRRGLTRVGAGNLHTCLPVFCAGGRTCNVLLRVTMTHVARCANEEESKALAPAGDDRVSGERGHKRGKLRQADDRRWGRRGAIA